jgi:hypothetical protein
LSWQACAADWLVALDISGIKRHLEEARRQDEQLAEQRLTCGHCPHSWVRLVLLENGGVTDEALEPVRCSACRREVDPRLDGEMMPAVTA